MATSPRQLTIVSGKGGTGKTTVVGSFAALAENKVMADCDVDAANLYQIITPNEIEDTGEFMGAQVPVRDEDLCIKCGACEEACRFDAITVDDIDELACEGCAFCTVVCPENALTMEPYSCGTWRVGSTNYGRLVYARLNPGAESSGRLVTMVRQKAEDIALQDQEPFILIDGAPGIGCVATAAIADTDMALVVTEPTLSGIHDMERVSDLIAHFGIPLSVIINKWDINEENSERIAEYCAERDIEIIARLPYDETVTEAMAAGTPLVEYTNSEVAEGIRAAWSRMSEILEL
ncbi:MAG: ATP-binding protein [Armatimonadota bacterium]